MKTVLRRAISTLLALFLSISLGPAAVRGIEAENLESLVPLAEVSISVAEFAGGDGSAANPFLISAPEHLNNVRNYLGTGHADKHFKLTADLDLNVALYNSGNGWLPIGTYTAPFFGTFDGDDRTISGLYINNTTVASYVALFGYTGAGATIRNLTLANANITGPDYVGTLVGWNNGLIERSSASGVVAGDSYMGGLIGKNKGTVDNCFFTGDITAVGDYTGGLIGDNSGAVTDCHAMTDVVGGGDWAGGLIGGNFGPVSDCYAAGTVTGDDYTGGLTGWNFSGNISGVPYNGSVTDSHSTVSVTATGWDIGGLVGSNDGIISGSYAAGPVTSTADVCVGGLVGSNYNPISNSYATGNVEGKDAVGGLIGYNDHAVTNCYSTGTVRGMAGRTDIGGLVGNMGGSVNDIVTNSFWDTESSAKATSVEGTGKTTAQMKQQATFTGWDFTTVWGINGTDNGGYPFLRWQGYVHTDPVTGACRIGDTGYATLDAALATLADHTPATIVFLQDIIDGDGISLSRKNLTIDLNGKNFTVTNDAGVGIDMNLLSTLNFTGPGNVAVRSGMAGLGLTQSDFIAAGDVVVDIESVSNWGVSTDTQCTVSFTGDVRGARGGIYMSGGDNEIAVAGTVTSTGNYSENHAIRVSQYDNTVQVGSALVSAGSGAGVYVDTSAGAVVTIGSSETAGQVVGKGNGLWIRSGATITVYGDIEGAVRGIYTVEDSTVTVHGNVTSTAATGEGQGVYCFANSTPATIIVNGNVEGISGAYVHGGGSTLTINGHVTARGTDPAANYGIYASYAEVSVSGNLTAGQCLGAHSFESSEIQVDGTLSALNYLKTKYVAKTSGDTDATSARAGYLQYSSGDAFVWIAAAPPAANICRIGEIGYTSLDAALASIGTGGSGTITLLENIDCNQGVTLDNKVITFDLNGFTLNIVSAVEGVHALDVYNGGDVILSGTGALNVTGPARGYGVTVHSNGAPSVVTVTNAGASGTEGKAAHANGNASLTVLGDVTATGIGSFGVHAQTDALIEVRGNVSAGNQGVCVSGATARVDGNVQSNGNDLIGNPEGIGVNVYDGVAEIGGNVTANRVGAMIRAGGSITIDGTLAAPDYIQFADDAATGIDDYLAATTLAGYRTYQHATAGTVWIWGESTPAATLPRRARQTPTYQASIRAEDGTETAVAVLINRDDGFASIEEDPWHGMPQGELAVTIPAIPGVDAYALSLPVRDLSTPDAQGMLEISTEQGSVAVPSNMLTGMGETAGNQARITIGSADRSALPEGAAQIIGDRPLVQLELSIDGRQLDWNNPQAPVRVSIPYAPTAAELDDPEHIVVVYVDGAGNLHSVPNGRYDAETGTVTFTTTHFSHYAVAYVHKTFEDLEAVLWGKKQIEVLASKGIIKGMSQTAFAPEEAITRADFLCLLVRTLGWEGEPEGSFGDVAVDTYYWRETGIAKELGIVDGVGNDRFDPDSAISRQDMMVMTERALGVLNGSAMEGAASGLDRFADRAQIAGYAVSSIAALAQEGLVEGSGGEVNPRGKATRAETAVFLYRVYNREY